MFDTNKLIGIPFKLYRKDFSGCDCLGIVQMYYYFVKEKTLPEFKDGKTFRFRNKKQDLERMVTFFNKIAMPVEFVNLTEGDIVILKNTDSSGALGICINNRQLLHMNLVVGSCLTPLRYLKELFFAGFRPNV